MALSKPIGRDNVAHKCLIRNNHVDRLAGLFEAAEAEKEFGDVFVDDALQLAHVGFGEEERDGCAALPVQVVVYGGEHGLRGVEVCLGPGVLVFLLPGLA